jgi:gluconokinase
VEKQPVDYRAMPHFLPFIFGERCPGWNDAKPGGFYGLRDRHGPVDLYFSVLEGILFNLYQCYEALCAASGKTPSQIQLSGGILNSERWMQLCADIFGRELFCAKIPHSSMVGGAVLAMAVTGHLDRIDRYQVETGKTVYPNPEMRGLFQERYQRYLSFYRNEG